MRLDFKKIKLNSAKEEKKQTKKKSLDDYPDTYENMVESRELQISDSSKLVFSVARKGPDGLPHIDIRLHVASDQYTGPTKKGVNFDTEYLYDFMEIISDINSELEGKGV